MSDQLQLPVQIKPVPVLVSRVGGALGPVDLKTCIVPATPAVGPLIFAASLLDGRGLPDGVICTQNGLLAGIPANATEGQYDIVITANDINKQEFKVQASIVIKERVLVNDPFVFNDLKFQVWEALEQNLPAPDFADLINRPISAVEIYYLLQRFAVLTIWDVYNLEQPGKKQLLSLPNTNKHYNIYDRGSCLVAAPKDLFSHERSFGDALDVARTLAGEVYKRGWTIEFAGFNKMVRAAWVELQILGDKHGKKLEILHYNATPEDVRTYSAQAQQTRPTLS